MKLSPDLVDLPQENKPVSSLSAAVGFVTRRRHPAPADYQEGMKLVEVIASMLGRQLPKVGP